MKQTEKADGMLEGDACNRPVAKHPETALPRPSIIWIIVDSVRNYRCNAANYDDRGRLEIMDELAGSWVDFRTVVTSAPSTLMSMGAMFTGCPAYRVGTAFDGLSLSDCSLPLITTILRRNGYKPHYVTRNPLEREHWAPIFDPVPRKLWPKGARHRDSWTNDQVTEALSRLLAARGLEPLFLFLHYNCRGEPRISEIVGEGVQCLREHGLEDNSIIFLTSDHGYPDPLRKEYVAKRRREIGLAKGEVSHDLVLTDDNVLIPLLVKFPGSQPMRIEEQICTLDYLPTALDLAGVPYEGIGIGRSVVPLLRGQTMPELVDRKVRIDGRFLAQTGRLTAIRSRSRKYILYPDEPGGAKEEFYDLGKDPQEVRNLITDGLHGYETELDEFRQQYRDDEEDCRVFIVDFLGRKYQRQLERLVGRKALGFRKVLYVPVGRPLFDEMIERILRRSFASAEICVVAQADLSQYGDTTFDLVHAGIVSKFGNRGFFKKLFRIRTRERLLIDLCGNVLRLSRFSSLMLLRSLWQKRQWYLQEPMCLLLEMWKRLNEHS